MKKNDQISTRFTHLLSADYPCLHMSGHAVRYENVLYFTYYISHSTCSEWYHHELHPLCIKHSCHRTEIVCFRHMFLELLLQIFKPWFFWWMAKDTRCSHRSSFRLWHIAVGRGDWYDKICLMTRISAVDTHSDIHWSLAWQWILISVAGVCSTLCRTMIYLYVMFVVLHRLATWCS